MLHKIIEAKIEMVRQQIDYLEERVRQTEARLAELEQEAESKRGEVAGLEQQEEQAKKRYFAVFDALSEKQNIDLPELKREESDSYGEMLEAKRKKEEEETKMKAAIIKAEEVDRLVEDAQEKRDFAQEKYNEALSNPVSRTSEHIATGTLSRVELEIKRCGEVLEQAQKKVDALLRQQEEVHDKKGKAEHQFALADMDFFFADGRYERAVSAVNECEDKIGELQHESDVAKIKWDDAREQLSACESKILVLENSHIPNASQQLVQARNDQLFDLPKLEAMLEQLMEAHKEALARIFPDRQSGGDYMPPTMLPS